MATCKYCDRPIDWMHLKHGWKPVETEEIAYDEAEAGDELVTFSGQTYTVDKNQSFPNVRGRLVHFGKCPHYKRDKEENEDEKIDQ